MSTHQKFVMFVTQDFKEDLENFMDLIEYDDEFIDYIEQLKAKNKKYKNKNIWSSCKIRIAITQWLRLNAKRLSDIKILKLKSEK